MRVVMRSILEQVWHPDGYAVRVGFDPGISMQPGQYLLAATVSDVLATPLFLQERWEGSLLTAPPVPEHWRPGTELQVTGPLGKGFLLPAAARHVALAGFCDAGYLRW